MFKKITLLSVVLLFLMQCRPVENKRITDVNWDLTKPELQRLLTLQDKQASDSLFPYFHSNDPTYRYGAALAFASIRDKSAIDSLATLLKDEVMDVRIAAAYALGQIGDEKAEASLIQAFKPGDSTAVSDAVRGVILEAIGKTGSEQSLHNLATISTFLRADTTLLEGQAWGIYRFALRNKVVPEGTSRMVDFIARRGYPESVRLIAANYLGRAKNIQLDSMATLSLSKALAQSVNPDIRMGLALALGKTKSGIALNALTNRLAIEKDYRVKCNILRALNKFDYKAAELIVTPFLDDENLNIAKTAAQFFVNNGIPRGANVYWRKARDTSLHWQVQLTLFKAANKYMPAYFEVTKGQLNSELKNRLAIATNNYEKAEVLNALSQYPWNYKFIKEQGFEVNDVVVRTASVQALADIARNPDFVKFFGNARSKVVKRDLKDCFVEAIEKRDVSMMALAAEVLREPELGFIDLIDSLDFLVAAKAKLSLPKEMETWLEVQKTLDFFNGKTINEEVEVNYNHPIDWEMLSALPEGISAEIETDKGEITISFYPDLAPGAVLNFVQLAKNGYYDGKNFHRIVSNFVAQGGCSRGDGYGALDYSIRTELPMANYNREGVVGMARSGYHTECTQFFITHCPTPHLDGKYTIFAQVTKGMDVVHELEQGDKIKKVVIR